MSNNIFKGQWLEMVQEWNNNCRLYLEVCRVFKEEGMDWAEVLYINGPHIGKSFKLTFDFILGPRSNWKVVA